MSLKAFLSQGLKRLVRKTYGAKLPAEFSADEQGNINPVEGGATHDTGVNEFAVELLGALGDDSPIQLAGSLQMIQPSNGAAIQIYGNTLGQFGSLPVIQFIDQGTGQITNFGFGGTVNNITNSPTFTFPSGQTNPAPSSVAPSVTTPVSGGGGFTGSLTVLTGGSLSTVGCTTTFSATTQTIVFQAGQIVSVS